jgi:cytidine deaminase
MARDAKAHAYAPYSNLKVGAAVKDDRGLIVVGTNVENASYGLTCCAERVAIFNAISGGAKRITELAVSCPLSGRKEEMMPCGACLQIMQEFMDGSGGVYVDGVGRFTLAELLPHPFGVNVGASCKT